MRAQIELVSAHRPRQEKAEETGVMQGCEDLGRQLPQGLDARSGLLQQLDNAFGPRDGVVARRALMSPDPHCRSFLSLSGSP